MGKQQKDEIDEQAIIASFLPDEPESVVAPAGSGSSQAGESSQRTEPLQAVVRSQEEGRRRKSREKDYESLFIRSCTGPGRTGKSVYLRREFHDTILRITQVIGNNSLTISGFIDNVLEHHFKTYEEEITRLYESKYKGVFTAPKQ